jgi:hypothetical protein
MKFFGEFKIFWEYVLMAVIVMLVALFFSWVLGRKPDCEIEPEETQEVKNGCLI